MKFKRKMKEENINNENNISNINESVNNSKHNNSEKDVKEHYENELKKKDEIIADLNNKIKYQQAENINYRKRKDEETANLLKFANQDLILELIITVDNFERAIKLDDTNLNDELSKFLAGFKLIYSHLTETLKKFEVEEIPTIGCEFDPNVHEALMTGHDETKPNDTILECLLKGYTLKGKVIRAAKVIVNKLD